MQELNIKNSEKLKVFIDELPDFSKIPLSELNLFISELELMYNSKIKVKHHL